MTGRAPNGSPRILSSKPSNPAGRTGSRGPDNRALKYIKVHLDGFAAHGLRLVGFAHTGRPDKLYTDNGPAFRRPHLEIVCPSLGIKCLHTAPYHAWSKGQLERFSHGANAVRDRLDLPAGPLPKQTQPSLLGLGRSRISPAPTEMEQLNAGARTHSRSRHFRRMPRQSGKHQGHCGRLFVEVVGGPARLRPSSGTAFPSDCRTLAGNSQRR